ncbi:MAG: uroporphyrinogen-III C-methyltransferase [Alphaproteobacteria bacterium]
MTGSKTLAGALPALEPGHVWLVGAGPGDPGLLTAYALQALGQADVVVYDALVDRRVLDLAGPQASLEYAGKRGGRPSAKQPDISARLVRHAHAGKRVLRLKGGDPLVFGRGAEEALALVAAAVPFRIVPGITAGTGGLAYAGIPLTHRDTNTAVTFVTGHNAAGTVPDNLNWQALAQGGQVLVFYMALNHLATICGRLMAHGRHGSEPAALVVSAATERQQVVETTIGEAAQTAKDAALQPPAIFVVGEVVRLRAGLDWLGALEGRQLVADPLGRNETRQAS